jgi:hypothetical protein
MEAPVLRSRVAPLRSRKSEVCGQRIRVRTEQEPKSSSWEDAKTLGR